MDFYLGLVQIIGVHTLLGLSAYCVLLTGQVSLAQAGFFAIGAYVAGMLTVLASWPLVPALVASAVVAGAVACAVGFPALRVKGLMLVVATVAFGEAVRLFFFNFTYQIAGGKSQARAAWRRRFPPDPLFSRRTAGRRSTSCFSSGSWSRWSWPALWWLDRSRAGAVLRAVGEDEIAAQSAGINITAVKVSAMTIGGVIAGIGGGIFAHYTTHIEHVQFGVVLATFAIAYPILGGLSSVFGTLLAVIFIQGFLIEGLRFMGDWRNLSVRRPDRAGHECTPARIARCRRRSRALKRLFSFEQGAVRCLSCRALSKHFGGVRAVDGVDLTVARGEIARPDRAQRLRQEHDRQSDLRPVSADRGPRHVQWRRHFRSCRRTRA